MINVDIHTVHLPDWGWHYTDDTEENAKLSASLRIYGQLTPLLVREVNGSFEVIDGRRRLNALRQLGVDTIWVHNRGALSQVEAVQLAVALELHGRVDYARLALHIKQAEECVSQLAMTGPLTADRLRYLTRLLDFDWSMFEGGQANLLDEFEPILQARKAPGTDAVKAALTPQSGVKAVSKPQTAVISDISAAARRAARTYAPAADVLAPSLAATPVESTVVTAPVIMFEDTEPPDVVPGWVPDTPPELSTWGVKELEFDCETTGLRWWAGDRPIGFSGTLPDGKSFYLPFGHKGGGNLDEAVVKRWAETELRGLKLTGANIRFDNHMTREWGVDLEAQGNRLGDVQHYAALIDEYRKEFGLDTLAKDFLGEHKTGEDLDKSRMADYHASQVAEYAKRDAWLVQQIKRAQWPMMDAEELHRVRELEEDVIYVVCEMEKNAAHVDRAQLHAWATEANGLLGSMLYEIGQEVAFQVNPDRAADWGRLFNHLKLPYPGVTEKGNPSFADALLALVDHPLVQRVRRAGKLASIKSKFLDPYRRVVGEDNKLRFALHQLRGDEYGTVRGRFSMSGADRVLGQFGANLQQVMRVNSQREAFGYAHNDASHDEEIYLVRALFKAAEAYWPDGTRVPHLSADAQAIEYRLAVHFSKSERLISAYAPDWEQLKRGDLKSKWVDFHGITGDVIRRYKDLSRNVIKNCNFGYIYGSGLQTMSDTIGLPIDQTDEIRKIYLKEFPEFRTLLNDASELAKSRGFVRTVMGRRARFPTNEYAHAAINYAIQGSAADIMKAKLVELHKERHYTGLLMRMTVHDEVDGDAQMPETEARVREVLNRQSFNLRVPIVWEVETGPNWAEAH